MVLALRRVMQGLAPRGWAADSSDKGGQQQRRPGIEAWMDGIVSVPREHDAGRPAGACRAERGGGTRPSRARGSARSSHSTQGLESQVLGRSHGIVP
jgi:hypothetical protein